MGVPQFRGMLSVLWEENDDQHKEFLPASPNPILFGVQERKIQGEPTSLGIGTANSHFSLSTPPDELRASVE
jgi:hypothetical protein